MNELAELLSRNEDEILAQWIQEMTAGVQRPDLISKTELDEQCRALLEGIVAAVRTSGPTDTHAAGWTPVRDFLSDLSASRARQGGRSR